MRLIQRALTAMIMLAALVACTGEGDPVLTSAAGQGWTSQLGATGGIIEITFDKNDAAATGTMPAQKVNANNTVELLTCAYASTGKTFAGWATSPTGVIQYADKAPITLGSTAVTLYARWNCVVTFDKNGGSTPSFVYKTVLVGDPYGELATTTRAGYAFAGWWPEAGGAGSAEITNQTIVTKGNHTLWARWVVNTYTVSFDVQDGTPQPASISVVYGAAYGELPDVTKAGMVFMGWWTGTGVAATEIKASTVVATASHHTLYARWGYTVTFNSQGGSDVSQQFIVSGGKVTQPTAPTQESVVFGGWYRDSTCTTAWIFATDTVSANTTLYAKWLPKYTMSFDTQGGSLVSSQLIGSGSLVPHPSVGPTKSDGVFGGWYTDSACTIAWNFATAVITSNTTLFAKWNTGREFVIVPGGTFVQKTLGTGSSVFQHTISGFKLGQYEVTYELWYQVKQWSQTQGYKFYSVGIEGHDGGAGAPTAAKYEPVTGIYWRDAMVWCNAYSQMEGKTPVYCSDSMYSTPIKDSSGVTYNSFYTNAGSIDAPYVNWVATGYRLPTEGEWQYAASYLDGSSWTPYNYASGATAAYTDATATGLVTWYSGNSGYSTKTVGTKKANALGIYDMSGNVWEMCWDWDSTLLTTAQIDFRGPAYGYFRTARGGAVNDSDGLQVGNRGFVNLSSSSIYGGFRLAQRL